MLMKLCRNFATLSENVDLYVYLKLQKVGELLRSISINFRNRRNHSCSRMNTLLVIPSFASLGGVRRALPRGGGRAGEVAGGLRGDAGAPEAAAGGLKDTSE